jgi:cobalt-zinc-cadmium resistance protein CzcA
VTNRLIALALRFRILVISGVCLLVAGGAWSFTRLTVDAFPDLTPNQVDVLTLAPGLSPNEVENLVSYPLETAMMGLPRTTKIQSVSKAGISVVTVSLEDDVDLYFARAQVQQRMQDAMDVLPEGIRPMLGPAATAMGEVYQYLVESDSVSLIELKNIQEYIVKPFLRTIPGVADVSAWGGLVQAYQIQVDPQRLAAYGITLDDVRRMVGENNDNFGAGYIETQGQRLSVRGLGRVATESDIENIMIATRPGGTPILVRDVAQVVVGALPRQGAVSRDGRGEAVSGKIIMLKGSNGREVIRQSKASWISPANSCRQA